MPEFVHVSPGHIAGDPTAGRSAGVRHEGLCGRWSDLAVQGHRRFQGHERSAVPNVAGEWLIQATRLLFESSNFDVNSGSTQLFEAAPTHFRIRIGHGGYDALNPSLDQGVGTGRSSSLMGVGFQVDIKRSPACFHSGLFEGNNLRVLYAVVGVCAGTENIAVSVGNNGPDVRVGRSQTDALTS